MLVSVDARLLDREKNTGISRYTEFVINYYLQNSKVESVILITNSPRLVYKNCRINYTRLRPFNLFHFLFFGKILIGLKVDLHHSPFYVGLSRPIGEIKSVVTVHDLMFLFVDRFFGSNRLLSGFKKYYFKLLVSRTLINADRIIAVSATTRNDIKKYFGLNSVWIPENVHLSGRKSVMDIEKFGLKKRGYFLYCGNGRPHKNLSFVKGVFENNPRLSPLILCGKGHKGAQNVIPLGLVSEEDLICLYSNAIAFVFPSLYEGFGLPILESLYLETPVVASRISAFEEFDSANIFYFDINSEEQFLKAIKASQDHSFVPEPLMWKIFHSDRLFDLYDELLNDFFKDH